MLCNCLVGLFYTPFLSYRSYRIRAWPMLSNIYHTLYGTGKIKTSIAGYLLTTACCMEQVKLRLRLAAFSPRLAV